MNILIVMCALSTSIGYIRIGKIVPTKNRFLSNYTRKRQMQNIDFRRCIEEDIR